MNTEQQPAIDLKEITPAERRDRSRERAWRREGRKSRRANRRLR